jgi:hypothetical protein
MYCDKMRDIKTIHKYYKHDNVWHTLTHTHSMADLPPPGWHAPWALDGGWSPPPRVLVVKNHEPHPYDQPEFGRRVRGANLADDLLRAATLPCPRTPATEATAAANRVALRLRYPNMGLADWVDVLLCCPMRDDSKDPCYYNTNDVNAMDEHLRLYREHRVGVVKANPCNIVYEGEEGVLPVSERRVFTGPPPAGMTIITPAGVGR